MESIKMSERYIKTIRNGKAMGKFGYLSPKDKILIPGNEVSENELIYDFGLIERKQLENISNQLKIFEINNGVRKGNTKVVLEKVSFNKYNVMAVNNKKGYLNHINAGFNGAGRGLKYTDKVLMGQIKPDML